MSKIDIIIERLKTAPPEVVDQIYALMETAERQAEASKPTKRRLSDLFGSLKDSKTFEGDPVAIQRAMRDEWR